MIKPVARQPRHRRSRPVRRAQQSGQVILILAITLVVILSMVSLAIDGSYGFIQERQDQNAADFATLGVADELKAYCVNGQLPPTTLQVWNTAQDLISQNANNLGTSTLTLTDGANPPARTQVVTAATANNTAVPPWACGAQVNVPSTWHTFLGGIVGEPQLATAGNAIASAVPTTGEVAAIYSLNQSEPHVVLAGGSGSFSVNNGDIYLSTTAQTWGGTHAVGGATYFFDDAMDVKETSSITVYGTVHSPSTQVAGNPIYPLDTCFENQVAARGIPGPNQNPQYDPLRPSPPNNVPPNYDLNCGTEIIQYNHVDTNWNPSGDPLNQPSGTVISDPGDQATFAGCSTPTNPPVSGTPGGGRTVVLYPGIYTAPLSIDTSAVAGNTTFEFADCGGSYQPLATGAGSYPGIYLFQKGLNVNLAQAGDKLLGNNIVLATGAGLAFPGNVPGTVVGGKFVATGLGNGAPCLPANVIGTDNSGAATAEDTATPCTGTGGTMFGTRTYGSSPPSMGTGMNFSLALGGATSSQITLNPAESGPWSGILLFQHRSEPANWGFDAEPGNASKVTLSGLLYNASLPNNGAGAPVWWWDPTGIMPGTGGIMQAGYGITSTNASGWNNSRGQVTVNGICLVENFNTDGYTDIQINGSPYNFPNGGLGPGLIG